MEGTSCAKQSQLEQGSGVSGLTPDTRPLTPGPLCETKPNLGRMGDLGMVHHEPCCAKQSQFGAGRIGDQVLVTQWIRRESANGAAMKNKANLAGRRQQGAGSRLVTNRAEQSQFQRGRRSRWPIVQNKPNSQRTRCPIIPVFHHSTTPISACCAKQSQFATMPQGRGARGVPYKQSQFASGGWGRPSPRPEALRLPPVTGDNCAKQSQSPAGGIPQCVTMLLFPHSNPPTRGTGARNREVPPGTKERPGHGTGLLSPLRGFRFVGP